MIKKEKITLIKNNQLLSKKKHFLNFFFPFFPIKVFKSLQLIFLIIFLICLRIIFGLICIPIAPFGISLSFAWVPLMVLGWYFGPLMGILLGILTDTINFLINGGLWYWMYAIQEPVVGMISGLIGSIARLRKNKSINNHIHIVYDLIINQIISLAFVTISFLFLIKWLNPYLETRNKTYTSFYMIYQSIALGFLICFSITYELFIFLYLIKRKNKNNQLMTSFLYSSINVIIIITLFSFILGPITAISYLKFIGKQLPEAYLKIGSIFYLVPRIAIESIKTPIEIWLLFSIVNIFDIKINILVNKINHTWQKKYIVARD